MKTGRNQYFGFREKYDEEELKNAFSEAEKEVEQAVLGKIKVWMK